MANRYSVKGQSNPSQTAFWSTARGGAGGASVPTDGDTWFMDWDHHITAGHSALDIDAVAGYINGRVSSTDTLVLGADQTNTGVISVANCNGELPIQSSGDHPINTLNVNIGHNAGRLRLVSGTFDVLYRYSGVCNIAASAVATTAYMFGGRSWVGDGTDFTSLFVLGGIVHSERGSGTTHLAGKNASLVADLDGAWTTINHYAGRCNYNSSGTLGTINYYVPGPDDGIWTIDGTTVPVAVTTANRYGRGPFVTQVGLLAATVGTDNNFADVPTLSMQPTPLTAQLTGR